jgi:YbbR domain-containing protein
MSRKSGIKFKKMALKTFTGKFALMVYSIFISILVWFIISVTIYPTAPKTISGVKLAPVTLGGQLANLSVVSPLLEKVTVQIQGNRTEVGMLKADSLTAKIVVDEVTGAGEYNLKIDIENRSGIEFDVLRIEPERINVTFDRIIEKRFDVTVDALNISVAEDDMFIDETTIFPNTVTIKGPAAQINSIDQCVAVLSDTEDLTDSYTTHTSKIVLYTADNAVLSQNSLTVPVTDFTVNINILTKKTLYFDFGVNNAPAYLDVDALKSHFNLSENSITIAAPKDSISNLSQTLTLGYIDLREILPDYSHNFAVNLPENFKNLSNINNVTATLTPDFYSQRKITIKNDNFNIINIPTGYAFDLNNLSKNITIIGPQSSLDTITAEDIIAEIDLIDESMLNLTFNKTFKILISQYPDCWAILADGDNYVTLSATTINPTVTTR